MQEAIKFCASYLVALCPTVFALVFWKATPEQRRTLLLRGILVAILSIACAKLGGMLYHEQRPFVVRHERPLIAHVADNGFPSDHTLLGTACALLVLPYSVPLAVFSGVVALIVGWARVAALLHSPLDIAASVVFALAANVVAWAVVRSRQGV